MGINLFQDYQVDKQESILFNYLRKKFIQKIKFYCLGCSISIIFNPLIICYGSICGSEIAAQISLSIAYFWEVDEWSLGFDNRLKKPPKDALHPIIPDNACILCLFGEKNMVCVLFFIFLSFLNYIKLFYVKSVYKIFKNWNITETLINIV